MARYDTDTEDFMDRTVGEQVARQAVGVAKDVVRGKPISESLTKRLIGLGAAQMTKDSGANPIALFHELESQHGSDWQDWEPETLRQELGTQDIELVQALQVIAKTNYPFEAWHVFENVAHALNRNIVHFGALQPVELDEAARAIKILRQLRPGQEFDDEVAGYLAAVAKNSGVVYLPDDLFPARCQPILDGLNNNLGLAEQVRSGKQDTDRESALSIQHARLQEIREVAGG